MKLLTEGIAQHAVIDTGTNKKLTIDGHQQMHKVYKIRLDCLYYNDRNDRIATYMSQYRTEHPDSKLEDMSRDEYNSVIQEFIVKSNKTALEKTQNNIKLIGQREPGVVLDDGRVIDGNRRFTCLRRIQEETAETGYFEAVILEHNIDTNEKQIKLLELMLQHGIDKPVDYDPIDKLVGIYNDIVKNKLLTVKEYARGVDQSENDILREVDKANLMVEFLEFAERPLQFHVARDLVLNDSLNELVKILKRCKDDDTREDLKNIVFASCLVKPNKDFIRYVRSIGKIAANPKYLDDFIAEQLGLTEQACDVIDKSTEESRTDIVKVFQEQEELQGKFALSTEKFMAKVNSDATRNQPAQQAVKALECLDVIDTNIFKKLNEEQKDDVRANLNRIEEILEYLRSELDV